jgi:putative acetyltransferase
MKIEIDDLSRPAVHALLREHLDNMFELSPPGQVFALDLSKLKAPEITVWTAWNQQTLLGCGALKELSPTQGEIKSMRTPAAARRQGAGRAILQHIISVARGRNYDILSLETGTHSAFGAAHHLYRRHGFVVGGPFGSYLPDPQSIFMHLRLSAGAAWALVEAEPEQHRASSFCAPASR